MGWMDRLLGTGPFSGGPDASSADVGVPDLVEPVYARALVLHADLAVATVEVQPPGRASFRVELRSGSDPGSFSGLVIRWHVPVIVDGEGARRVVLLEPPCGPDLPLVTDDLQAVRDARDLRTSALAARYPPPSAAGLANLMAPTASAAHPAWDAVCYRIGLLTTLEARAILDRIRSDGNAWERAVAELYSWGPNIPDDLRKQVGLYLSHLYDVAPQGRGIDSGPFWTLGVVALMRDLSPGDVDAQVFERVMRPFIEVCGTLPEQLL
ncbi:hypothetical protein [Tsukamurella tyrosinosolvens]|uniref:hypothetical protein n=1 Tax=Tsukamurella tyrosinosolvens TaxID=57704 RepID=UPI000DF70200|nr:hypothetical protein [Tsukamurella tyrosinosolvens]RDB49102.1 hypothetical protein DVB87_04795 [Tsukamurella tyrosinosolvens]